MSPCTPDDLLHSLFLFRSLLAVEFGKKGGSDGLSMPEYALMRQLARDGGPSDLASIREYLAVTKASVSQMLSSLEKRGLLVRCVDPANRRNLIVTLTPEGHERLRDKDARVQQRLQEMLADLGETDARQFIALVDRMNVFLSHK